MSARYLSTHYRNLRCWAFPDPEREVFDQVVLLGYRKADPIPDASAEETINRWSEGDLDRLGRIRYPFFKAKATPAGDILFTTPHRRSRRCGDGGQADGAVGQRGDNRLAVARKGQPHPAPDAPSQGPHGDAGGGGLSSTTSCSNPRTGASWSRAGPSKEMVQVEDTPEKEVYRERLKTTVVSLDLGDGEIVEIAA